MTSYPSRRTTRLQDYDYSQSGAYFVTLCVQDRLPLLGQVVDGRVTLTPAGEMVATVWMNLEEYYPVHVDAFVVMPNHVHGILVLGEARRGNADGEDRLHPSVDGYPRATVPTDSRTGTRSQGTMSLSTVIQRFKTFTMHEYGKGVAQQGWLRYPGRLWQHRFYDHVIRSERELAAIREYIATNPLRWHLDRENPEHLSGGEHPGMGRWQCVGPLRDYPQTIGDLEALLDQSGPHFELDGWMWCSRCQRAYPVGEIRVVKSGPGWTYYEWALECAVEGCEGRRADWHPWHPQELPRALHPEYPETPEAFAVYPLTGD